MYDGISSQHSPTRSFAAVTERTRRNFCVTFSFPNLIISTLEGGQFTFRPFYSQQKQVMLPINLLKTEKQVTVLLCSAVPRFLKEHALFESLHASPEVFGQKPIPNVTSSTTAVEHCFFRPEAGNWQSDELVLFRNCKK